jgi:ribosome maturation factor RimP
LKKVLEDLMEEFFIGKPNLFLVDFSMDPSNKINITIDGDNGVKIIDCVGLTKFLKKNLNEELDDFSVDVSSAGLFSPLVSQRQFTKNIKRKLNVQSVDGTEFIGNLTEVNESEITIEWTAREPKPIGKGKISVKKNKSIAFNKIKKANLIVEF